MDIDPAAIARTRACRQRNLRSDNLDEPPLALPPPERRGGSKSAELPGNAAFIWVFENIMEPNPVDPPSAGAWGLLAWARANGHQFYPAAMKIMGTIIERSLPPPPAPPEDAAPTPGQLGKASRETIARLISEAKKHKANSAEAGNNASGAGVN